MNILVLRYRFIGDTLLTVPFLRNLRRAHPGARIDMVVAPYSSDVLIGTPYVDEFIVYDPPTVHADSSGQHRSFGDKARFIGSLREKGYDRAYVLKRSFSSAVIALLSGARERIGFDTEKRGFLLTKKVPYRHDRHEIQNFLSILAADGIPVTDDYLEAWLSEDEIFRASRFLAESGIGEDQKVVGIHPFTANMRRAWHEDNFIDLANHIQHKQGARVIIFGGKREIPLGKTFEERIDPPPIVAVGKTSLRESMALLSRCALLVCNDSGIMHLAAALHVPLIALFGPQSPVKFGPWGDDCTVVYKHFDCSPCQQKFFTECDPSERMKPMCMETITTEEVIAIVDEKMSLTMTRP